MAIKLRARLAYRAGWKTFGQRMAETQKFVLPWIDQIEKHGSELVEAVVDDLEALLRCCPVVRLQGEGMSPEAQDALDDLTLHFVEYSAERGIMLLHTYLYEPAHFTKTKGHVFAFVVIRTTDGAAVMVLPDKKDAAWWPKEFRKGGKALSRQICNTVITRAIFDS